MDNNGSLALSLSSGPIIYISKCRVKLKGTLTLGETATYTASYTITQVAVDAGGTSNTVLATASSPGNTW